MSDGTALPRFKRAFIAAGVTAGIPNISYQSPMQPEDIIGEDGSGSACWFEDAAQGELTIAVVGAPEIWINETWPIPFRIQVLGTDTDADQEAVDQAACELLGDVLGLFTDPTFGLVTDADIQVFSALPVGAEPWNGGRLSESGIRAAGFTLTIELTARLVIGS